MNIKHLCKIPTVGYKNFATFDQ